MKFLRFSRFAAGTCVLSVLVVPWAEAQFSPQKVAAIDKTLQHVKASIAKLDARHRQMLDGYSNVSRIADTWHSFGIRLTDTSFVSRARRAATLTAGAPGTAGIVKVSNSSNDIAFSSFGGFTQSETSTARCGNNVVAGFNDSGSVFETPFFFTGTGGQAFSGAAYSTNGGTSFTDVGPMNPGTNDGNFLGGDPGVTCSDPDTFYFSQIFDFSDTSGNFFAAIAVNQSTDGGKTWDDPISAIAKDGSTHLLDKPWSTIDPTNPKRIFVSYTDFDFTFSSPFCGNDVRTAIEFVKSSDGGNTWSTPRIAIQVCGAAAVQGSQLAVDSHGTLFISWVNLGNNFPLGPRQIQISSLKGGMLSPPVIVEANLQPGGDSFFLQGEFRDFLDMAMAVDRSGTASDGTLYITWADGRDKIVPDPLATQGFYAYDDVLLRQSFDGGNTWGFAPIKINSDTQSRLGSGHDHYQSAIAVDKRGVVAACWYDRRADSEDFAIRHHCGESTNSGSTWSDADINAQPFAPTHGNDIFVNPIYMGDYDVLTSDFLNHNSGFIGSFQVMNNDRGNPDVVAHPMN